jgi:hypothetical protein
MPFLLKSFAEQRLRRKEPGEGSLDIKRCTWKRLAGRIVPSKGCSFTGVAAIAFEAEN